MAKKKKDNGINAKYYSDLYNMHSSLYNMSYEDSKKVVNSVLASIRATLQTCEVLSLPDFGKFENRKREPRMMTDNFPGSNGKKRLVPTKYTVKFVPFQKFNSVSEEYHLAAEEAKGGEN